MQYLEYERYKVKYNGLQWRFSQILLEKEKLFTKTQPDAIRYDKDKIQSSVSGNMLDNYVISLEEKKIDQKLSILRKSLKNWQTLLDLKERELRRSKSMSDRIYVLKYIDGQEVSKIAGLTNYSKSQIYRILRQIEKRCDNMRQNMWYY